MVALAGCSKKEVKQEGSTNSGLSAAGTGNKDKNFKVEYSSPRVVYKVEEVDLDNNGKDEYIVFSVANDSLNKDVYQFYKFDMMEVFVKDSINNSYRKISIDTVDFSDEYWIMNLEKDKSKQIIIKTNMGGNDVVNSRGMYVFNYDSLKVNLVKYFDTGNPQIKDLNSDGNKEVIVEDTYRGVLPEAGAVYYTSEIFKYSAGKLIKSNGEFKNYFAGQLDNLLNEFEKMKNRISNGEKIRASEYPLYRQAVHIIMYYISTEDYAAIAKFWNNENDYLKKNLQDDEYEDLKKFISKLPPIASTI
jgi:DNA polymerase III delta prime subunit